MADLSSTRVFGKLTVLHEAILKANAEIVGTLTVDTVNATNYLGLPTEATRWPAWNEVTGKPTTFAPSTHTHPWGDLTGVPDTASRWPAWSEVTSKPTFAAVATSGSYGDLSNTPNLSTVATTGSYTDLVNRPSNATQSTSGFMSSGDKSKLDGVEAGATADQTKLDIDALNVDADTVDGQHASAFATSAQGSLADSSIQPGDNISTLTNDSGYITDYTVTQGDVTQHETALTITESQISDLSHFTPSTLLADYGFTDNSTNWNTAYGWGDHANAGYALASNISTVGTTGNYNDLTNKPDLSALDEVHVYATQAGFPASGVTGKVYIAEDTGYMYRWNGSSYTQMSDQTAVWGQISGSLSNQTDLLNALNAKLNVSLYTAADVKSKYESNSNTNVFTDAEQSKLAGIEAGADVNVATDLGSSRNATTYTITSSTGGNTTLSAATTTNSGVMSASDKSKLDGVESGATADQTKADIDALNVDADTLDGQHASAFATSAQGSLADSAVQPGDGNSTLTNDSNFITSAGAPVQSVNTQTGAVSLSATDVGAYPNTNPSSFVDAAGAVSAVKGDVAWNAANWDTAFGWGDHASEGYITDAPIDGKQYLRKDGAWHDVTPIPPTLNTPTSGVERDEITITIGNYDANNVYSVTVEGGTVSRVGNTITWVLPSVDANTDYNISVSSLTQTTQLHSMTVDAVTVMYIPYVADDAVIITSFGSGSYNDGWMV